MADESATPGEANVDKAPPATPVTNPATGTTTSAPVGGPFVRPQTTTVDARAAETPSEAVTAAAEPAEAPKVGYSQITWHGLPGYDCQSCILATLDEDEIRAHIASAHPQVANPTA